MRRLAMPAMLQSLREPDVSSGEASARRRRWPRRMERALAGSIDQTARAIRAGVPILAGSDAGNPVTFHGVSLIRELELLAQAGMPLGEVLKSATSRAADRLGQATLGGSRRGRWQTWSCSTRIRRSTSGPIATCVEVYLGGRKLEVEDRRASRAGPRLCWQAEQMPHEPRV